MSDTNNPCAVEGDFSFIQPQPFNFCFAEGDKEVGRLFLEEDHLKFEGNADESAKVFFDEVLRLWGQNKGSVAESTVAQIAHVQEPLTDKQKRELIKNSALWDMHIHIGWYSAPSKSFVEKTIQLIADIEAAHGITAARAAAPKEGT
jgi:hypothetical protein